MPCIAPNAGWRHNTSGKVYLSPPDRRVRDNYTFVALPCTKCIECDRAESQAWALRCQLENSQHLCATFATLT